MTRIEVRVKKQRTINKKTIVFSADYNPRGPYVNAIINKREHISQNNTVLKELFPSKSITVANKRGLH